MLAAGDGVEQLAILIKDFDLKIAEDVAALLIVVIKASMDGWDP